ncbi:uncharacterized protein F5891DRAFT_989368 [Suillus fuscotomentosus]|uniref:Uncharacterized protein n=1 Tax=Suillus fuscotomentosus TaxID=1912939 RepID=A0AAD4DNA2_9AGAM|nr:uncharacterized protein F5891DRAFT_989368 [Suillus fuscotomentosus]KAG1885878.1 hypothetical protein F5891DRAFT_989368 [Suillus fuscotomentosus]
MASNTITTLNPFQPPSDGSQPYTMQIEDVCGREELDNAGFQYGREAPKYTTSFLNDEIEREYYHESIDLMKRVTVAQRNASQSPGLIWTKLLRLLVFRSRDANPHETDVNPHSGDANPHETDANPHETDKVPSLLHKRFQIIDLWRPISHAAVDRPLALCDFRSVDFDKAVALIYPDRSGNYYEVVPLRTEGLSTRDDTVEGWSAVGTCCLKESDIRERTAYPSIYVGSESTCVALLVPPDPLAKPVLSLTYILVSLYTRRVASEETHHGDELGCGQVFELKTGGSGATMKLLIHGGADLY